ncbi:DUF937 domain-containing protein [Fontibacter flavus]|uniref:DUF937 domain-containing protein n=1 Tax=Fontibacter flavus TaxID=654838 RepID=A0ABV6FXW3_9BACT
MIQEILSKLSPELINGLTNQIGLDSTQAKNALDTTKDSLMGSLGKEIAGGNFDGILNMLNEGSSASNTPMFQKIIGSLSSSYMSKLGLSADKASMISSFILPKIISAISNSKSGNFNQTDLIGMLGKNLGDSLGEKAGNLLKGGLGNLFK